MMSMWLQTSYWRHSPINGINFLHQRVPDYSKLIDGSPIMKCWKLTNYDVRMLVNLAIQDSSFGGPFFPTLTLNVLDIDLRTGIDR